MKIFLIDTSIDIPKEYLEKQRLRNKSYFFGLSFITKTISTSKVTTQSISFE
jgi:hypothetical protein